MFVLSRIILTYPNDTRKKITFTSDTELEKYLKSGKFEYVGKGYYSNNKYKSVKLEREIRE